VGKPLPTTARLALLTGTLALLSNVAVVGFIHWRTNAQLIDALEDSLPVAAILAALLGLVCGGIVAKYVEHRIRDIVAVTGRITARDLSERVPLSGHGDAFDRLAEQINAMLDRISGLMEELRLLTDSLAHDLRSPVSRLRSAAFAAAEASDPKEQEELLGSVIRQADALMRILTTVLEISRSEALTSRNQFHWFDLGELAAELSEMYDPLADERGAKLEYDRPSRPVPLLGHRQLLAQAMSNLIENAIRYGSAGGEIRVSVETGEHKIRVEIADRGPGIPVERYDEARRRFGRLDSSRSDEGAGLGLALAEAIAHLHEGELVLKDNRPGLLTILDLPVRAEQTRAAWPVPACDQAFVASDNLAPRSPLRSFTERQLRDQGDIAWLTTAIFGNLMKFGIAAGRASAVGAPRRTFAVGSAIAGSCCTATNASIGARSAHDAISATARTSSI
jgi:signal transduction histidine kinase